MILKILCWTYVRINCVQGIRWRIVNSALQYGQYDLLSLLRSQHFNDESHQWIQWNIEDKMDSTAGNSIVMRNRETKHLLHFINALDQVTSQFSCRRTLQ